MPGAFMPASGSSVAPNKIFLGAVPDQYTMLMPAHAPNVTNAANIGLDNFTPAKNINQWSIVGGTVTLGALTTAPDGTNTAQKIVETAANSLHWLSAGFFSSTWVNGGMTLRVALFAKADARTRFALTIGAAGNPNAFQAGCTAVFDLANVQIGVAPTAFANSGVTPAWVPGPTMITPWPNGWCLCTMDVTRGWTQGTAAGILVGFQLDGSTGTAPINTTYAGDGSSGVFVWNSSALPPAAFNMPGNVRFFDDFLSSANMDLGRTLGPNFDWYPFDNASSSPKGWVAPGYDTTPVTGVGNIAVAGSLLTFTTPNDGSNMWLCGAHGDGSGNVYPGGFIGKASNVFQPPLLYETSAKWNTQIGWDTGAGGLSGWTTTLEQLTNTCNTLNGTTLGNRDGTRRQELDCFELPSGGSVGIYPNCSHFSAAPFPLVGAFDANETIIPNSPLAGFAAWSSTYSYAHAAIVISGGVVYQSQTGAGNLNKPPASNIPAFWQVYSVPGNVPQALYSPFVIDFSILHKYTTLWLPAGNFGIGALLTFFDGNFCGEGYYSSQTISAGAPGGQTYIGDGAHYSLQLSWLQFGGLPSGLSASFDYVRVTQ